MKPQPTPKKLLEEVRDVLRLKQYSCRSEEACIGWVTRYVLFHDKRHPTDLGAPICLRARVSFNELLKTSLE
ncbi:MAG: integrase [Caldiserica bacterium]|nr:integrase [Caldisericota bacterium]